MLVLTRKKNESIIINNNIVITVVDIRGDKVRLGVQAPIEISVHREEIYEVIQREIKEKSSNTIEKKVGGSGTDNILPKYYSIPKFKGNYYNIIDMGKYGEHIDYLI